MCDTLCKCSHNRTNDPANPDSDSVGYEVTGSDPDTGRNQDTDSGSDKEPGSDTNTGSDRDQDTDPDRKTGSNAGRL